MIFANAPLKLDDGQSSVVPFPEEIALRGFFPPVRMPDDTIEKGDVLPAGWLNSLIREACAIDPAYYFDHRVADQSFGTVNGASNVSYFRSDKTMLQFFSWKTANDLASYVVTFPYKLAAGTKPVILVWDSSPNNPCYFWIDHSQTTNESCRVWWKGPSGMTNPQNFYVMVMGEWAYSAGSQKPTALMNEFCTEPRKFIDGQTSFSAPSAEQISFGFAPTRQLDDGTIIPGDTLPANILNYIFHDLFAKRANGLQIKARNINSSGNFPQYVLIIGPFKIQMWRAAVPQGTPVVPYPESIANVSAPFLAATPAFVNAAGMTAGDYRVVGLTPHPQQGAGARGWGGGGLGTNVATDTNFLCIAMALDGDMKPPVQNYNPAVTPLPGFATSSRTYEDGQANKVQPSASQMNAGFLPSRKMSSGIIQQGDLVTANKLNWLLDQLYRQNFSHGEKRVVDAIFPDKPSAAPVTGATVGLYCVEGDDWIAYTGIARLNNTGYAQDQQKVITFPFLKPFKAGTKPMVMMTDEQQGNTLIIYNDTKTGDHTAAKLTAVSASDPSTLLSLPTSYFQMRFFIIGVKA